MESVTASSRCPFGDLQSSLSRLEVIFAAWPFLLVALVDPRRSAEDKRNITDSLFKAFECDLGTDVGIPLRALFEKIGTKGRPFAICHIKWQCAM